MPNIISSAIVNTPPPDIMADVLNKRNKVHHFDKETDEDMIPLFMHGVEGKPRNNKHLLPHRNWCSIRTYEPGHTPPQTPEMSAHDLTPLGSPPGRGGLLRRLTKTRGPAIRPDASRPPVSNSGGFMRSFSRGRTSTDSFRAADRGPGPGPGPGLQRTMSLTRDDFRPGNLFRRLSGRGRAPDHDVPQLPSRPARQDDGGINGRWGSDSDEDPADHDGPGRQPGRPADLPPAAARRLGIPVRSGGKGKAPDPYDYLDPPDGDDDDDVASGLTASDGGAAAPPPDVARRRRTGSIELGTMRGGGGRSFEEFDEGDESHFSTRPNRRAAGPAAPPAHAGGPSSEAPPSTGSAPEPFAPRPFHRTPTGLTAKQLRRGGGVDLEVDLEGGLEVCLNVEVSPRDPAGITAPYRLVVPRLVYEYEGEDAAGSAHDAAAEKPASGLKRFLSIGRGKSVNKQRLPDAAGAVGPGGPHGNGVPDDEYYDDEDDNGETGPYDAGIGRRVTLPGRR